MLPAPFQPSGDHLVKLAGGGGRDGIFTGEGGQGSKPVVGAFLQFLKEQGNGRLSQRNDLPVGRMAGPLVVEGKQASNS